MKTVARSLMKACRSFRRGRVASRSRLLMGASLVTVVGWVAGSPAPPNLVLVMAGDLGYGDVGYNGNPVLQTPHLDALAEVLKTAGYATGHFGKWHVGALSKTVKQSYFEGPVDPADYSPPWESGFDVCFRTESMMPTFNPYYHVGGDYGTPAYRFLQDVPVGRGQRSDGFRWRDFYWTGPGRMVDEWLAGDDSRIIMDRALPFMRRHAEAGTPFLAPVWFHTPHTPVVAGNEARAPYRNQPMDAQHYYGAISDMDRQVGRLRDELRAMGIADNTRGS